MTQPTLKTLLGKRSEATALFQAWLTVLAEPFAIEDAAHNLLVGTAIETPESVVPILHAGEIAGYVKGAAVAAIVAQTLGLLLQKEGERKKLGTEVLHLYQELNVIYNFSEKLSEIIEPDVIANITLQQALHSIPSNGGVMVLWNEDTKQLDVPATTGNQFFNEENIRLHSSVLLKIGLSGHSEIISELAVLKEKGIIADAVQSLVYAAMKGKQRIMGAIILAGTNAEQYSAAHLKLLVTLALQSSTAIESALLYEKNLKEVREREEAILRIYDITKKFVPNEFIRSLGKKNITDVKLGDQVEKVVTVLFTDIRDFTALSEKMSPVENFRFVSSFNEQLGPIIRAHKGFINQYLGDSIMAIFPRHPVDALNAAIAMQKAIFTLNETRQGAGLPSIKAGIGMHTGSLIMGITGDEQRLDAATISDTVNTAARIESLTKHYQSPLLLSGETLYHIPDTNNYQFRHLGKVLLKGKNNHLNIVECLNGNSDELLQLKTNLVPRFDAAIAHYKSQNFENAVDLFQQILQDDSDDLTAKIFMAKAKNYLMHGVPKNWNGAEEMLSK